MGPTTKNHILRRTARTDFFNWPFYFFPNHFFEYGFMHNVLRDFQKQIMHENGPFSRPFFCHIRLDMANKKYVMTISTEKGRKCMTQIFDFWKFITEIFAKLNERFSKIMKLRKIYKMAHFLGHFSTRYDLIWQIKNSSWWSARKKE